MDRIRNYVGMLAGLAMLLSSLPHALLGWPVLAQQLRSGGAPADLVAGLRVGWIFGGVAMALLGTLVVASFLRRKRDASASMAGAILVGVGYVAFSLWAWATEGFIGGLVLFGLPGLLVLLSAWPFSRRGAG